MSLIVAAADPRASADLLDRLRDIDATATAVEDLPGVVAACAGSAPDFVVCPEIGWAERVAESLPHVAVVLAQQEPVDRELVLTALRGGVSDVWILPMSSADMAARVRAIRSRQARAGSATARQLSRFSEALERDQRAGRYVQMGMLPPNPMAIEQFRFEHRILPSLILSGDFVDYFRISDRHFGFYVADVAGNGASSAFVTVLLKNFSRRLRREHRPRMLVDPGLILKWINTELLEQDIDKHVAVVLGVGDVERNQIHLVNGGHYPPALRVSGGKAEFVELKGKPVGLFADVSYEVKVLDMAPGDRLVMFSDGVIDALNVQDLEARESRLRAAALASPNVAEIWDDLGLADDARNEFDDMTCLVVRREG
jgi:phosphoserine phosphatase RsbU/P